ncbi:MAG: protein kinase [Polyangiaceae bacterium]|nr:protein kinase [Polyangiaceae bacterium]
MGVVYEVEHVLTRRRHAMKLLLSRQAGDAALARFVNEARAAASVGNAHIIDVTDMGDWDGNPYIVMELLEGRDLGEELTLVGPMTVDRTLEVADQVLAGIAAAHDRGVVHRDLKPSNVFLTKRDGVEFVKVLDFGVAKVEHGADLTGTGNVLGTPYYLAPEQAIDSKRVDARVDVYAMGAILYQMLSGSPPFKADTLAGLTHLIFQSPPPDVCDVRSDVPGELSHVIQRALAKRPEARFSTARELRGVLRALRESLARPSASLATPSPASVTVIAAKRPTRFLGVAAVVAALIAAAFAARTVTRAREVAPRPESTLAPGTSARGPDEASSHPESSPVAPPLQPSVSALPAAPSVSRAAAAPTRTATRGDAAPPTADRAASTRDDEIFVPGGTLKDRKR